MNFYFSFNHLTDTTEHAIKLAENLSRQAIRVSPRGGQTNREVLGQYCHLLLEADNLLKRKISIRKIAIRRPVLLFHALGIAYQRVLNLADASLELGHGNHVEDMAIGQLMYMARRHYRILRELMDELTGGPVTLAVPAEAETNDQSFFAILRREFAFQQEMIKLIEKAIQVFGTGEEVMAKLFIIRKDLVDTKVEMQQMISDLARECMAPV